MYELPTSIRIGEEYYPITESGDFRAILRVFGALNDYTDLENDSERIFAALVLFYEDINDVDDILRLPENTVNALVMEMYKFFNGGQNTVGATVKHKLLDWEKDEPLIVSAINNVAGKEVRAERYVHWWTFLGYYLAIGECPLATVVSIRDKVANGKKLEKYERDFKRDNPEYFNIDMRTAQDRKNDDLVKQLWNK